MATQPLLYLPRNPGDLITAEDWNEVQAKVKNDISDKIKTAVEQIKKVAQAGDAEKLGGKTPQQWEDEIIKKALAEIPKRTGYQMLFKRLRLGDPDKVIQHGLKACPLVDVYQLDYFQVVCSKDDAKSKVHVNFYLYHTSEKKIKDPGAAGSIEIEPTTSRPYKIPFKDMLDRYHVKYTDESSLGDLVTEFWKAIFADPNDEFDEDQYCHSPWFDKCCGEEKTVGDLKKKGDWDDIWFKMVPLKTLNYPGAKPGGGAPTLAATDKPPAPTQIQVVHFDFDTIGIKLLAEPVYPDKVKAEISDRAKELKVMLLLKV